MSDQKNIPLRGKRFLADEIAMAMLNVAMDHEGVHPICSQRATTHAVGCSVASLVARAMRANLNFLRNQVDICWGELMCEKDFSIAKLEEHIDILSTLNLLIFTLTADRVSAIVDATAGDAEGTTNIVTQAFEKLPRAKLTTYNEGIVRLRRLLEDDVLLYMIGLRDRIRESEIKGEDLEWGDAIRALLHGKIGPKLSEMFETLALLSDHVTLIVENVRKDWEKDLHQIEVSGLCGRAAEKRWKKHKAE